MKPFDLEKAKQGHTLITRNGQPARLLCYDLKGADFPLAVAYFWESNEETIGRFTETGKKLLTEDSIHDLFLAHIIHTRWALLGGSGDYQFIAGTLCDSEEAAKKERERYDTIDNLRIIEISWGE